jgi:hypothetical protein
MMIMMTSWKWIQTFQMRRMRRSWEQMQEQAIGQELRYLWRVFVDTTHSIVPNIFVTDAIRQEVCILHDWCDNLGFLSVKARYLLAFMPTNSSQTPNQTMPPSKSFFIDPPNQLVTPS